MHILDEAFLRAERLVSSLPQYHDPAGWWNRPKVQASKDKEAWLQAAEDLLAIGDEIPEIRGYFYSWAASALLGAGDLARALEVLPSPEIGGRSSANTDGVLAIKHALGERVTGRDVVTLFGPKLTKFGRENIEAIVECVDIRVTQLQEREGRYLLGEWEADCHEVEAGTFLFTGLEVENHIVAPVPRGLCFSYSPTCLAFCVDLMRDAENTFREELDLPKVGEGWISETELYYAIRTAFPDETVIQHGRPKWLGRQHLDVFLPQRGVALEYHGAQHDRPIEFFGGVEAFERNQKRDRRKLGKCRRHGVKVIYVREGYEISEIIEQIAETFET